MKVSLLWLFIGSFISYFIILYLLKDICGTVRLNQIYTTVNPTPTLRPYIIEMRSQNYRLEVYEAR